MSEGAWASSVAWVCEHVKVGTWLTFFRPNSSNRGAWSLQLGTQLSRHQRHRPAHLSTVRSAWTVQGWQVRRKVGSWTRWAWDGVRSVSDFVRPLSFSDVRSTRCRKKMKRVERRGTLESQQLAAAQLAASSSSVVQSQSQPSQQPLQRSDTLPANHSGGASPSAKGGNAPPKVVS